MHWVISRPHDFPRTIEFLVTVVFVLCAFVVGHLRDDMINTAADVCASVLLAQACGERADEFISEFAEFRFGGIERRRQDQGVPHATSGVTGAREADQTVLECPRGYRLA